MKCNQSQENNHLTSETSLKFKWVQTLASKTITIESLRKRNRFQKEPKSNDTNLNR
jgi:hypothetical protein